MKIDQLLDYYNKHLDQYFELLVPYLKNTISIMPRDDQFTEQHQKLLDQLKQQFDCTITRFSSSKFVIEPKVNNKHHPKHDHVEVVVQNDYNIIPFISPII